MVLSTYMVLLRAKETTTATVATTGLADGEASRGISGCAWRSRSGSWSLWRIGNRPPSVMPSWISWGGRQWGRDETLGPWSTVSFIWVNLWWNRVKHCPILWGDGWMSIFWPIEDDDGCSEVLQAPHLYAKKKHTTLRALERLYMMFSSVLGCILQGDVCCEGRLPTWRTTTLIFQVQRWFWGFPKSCFGVAPVIIHFLCVDFPFVLVDSNQPSQISPEIASINPKWMVYLLFHPLFKPSSYWDTSMTGRTAFHLQSSEGFVSKGQLLWMLADSGMPVNKVAVDSPIRSHEASMTIGGHNDIDHILLRCLTSLFQSTHLFDECGTPEDPWSILKNQPEIGRLVWVTSRNPELAPSYCEVYIRVYHMNQTISHSFPSRQCCPQIDSDLEPLGSKPWLFPQFHLGILHLFMDIAMVSPPQLG